MQIQAKQTQGAQQQHHHHKKAGGQAQQPQQSNSAFAGIKLPQGGLAR